MSQFNASACCKGIDTDHYDGPVDAAKVQAAGISFIIAKASQGTGFTDPQFAATWKGCGEVGLTRGAYHFFVAGKDPQEQAAHFLAVLQANGGLRARDLIPCIDIEDGSLQGYAGTNAELVADVHTFIGAVKHVTGRTRVMLYSNVAFLSEHLDDSLISCPLWVARYDAEPPASVKPWHNWSIWQCAAGEAGGHIVPGIGSSVDVNCYNGTHDNLVADLCS